MCKVITWVTVIIRCATTKNIYVWWCVCNSSVSKGCKSFSYKKNVCLYWQYWEDNSWIWLCIIFFLHHNKCHGVSNHRCLDCLPNRLFRSRSKKTSKLRFTGLCEGNPPVTGGLPSQRASNAENVSIWWRHHDIGMYSTIINFWSFLVDTVYHDAFKSHLFSLWVII